MRTAAGVNHARPVPAGGIPETCSVDWIVVGMPHGDQVPKLPPAFAVRLAGGVPVAG